jgi:hypothetical protein
MGYLTQASSAIANTPKLSGSIWMRQPASGTSPGGLANTVFEFGDRTRGPNWLLWNTARDDGTASLIFNFQGVLNSIDMSAYAVAVDALAPEFNAPPSWSTGGSVWTPIAAAIVPALVPKSGSVDTTIYTKLAANKWVHVAFAFDFSTSSTVSWDGVNTFYSPDTGYYLQPATAPSCRIVLNGATPQIGNQVVESSSLYSTSPITYTTSGFDPIVSGLLFAAVTDGTSIHNKGASLHPGPTWNGDDVTIPGFNLCVNGFEFGVPCQSDDAPYQVPLDFGDCQMWFGKFIDWSSSTNFSKIVSVAAGKGVPVDPAIAAAAFGQQTILFKGDHTHFPTNLGTGGTFSLVGTNIDFTPTPSYG